MTYNILIVDDDMMMRSIIEIYLKQQNFNIVGLAKNAKEAIDILKENKNIDIVLLDIYLKSDINGVQLANEISENFDIPIIFISADPDEETILKSVNRNVYGYLQKPLHKNNLRSTIFFAVAKHKKLKNAGEKS